MKKYHKQAEGQRSGEWVACRAENCRLKGDGIHITEFELAQVRNASLVDSQIAASADVETHLALAEVKDALERPYVPVTSWGFRKAVENVEAERAEAERLIREGSEAEMEAFVEERVNSAVFTKLLAKRDESVTLLASMKADRDVLFQKWESDPKFSYEDVRQKELAMVDINEEILLLRQQTHEYKNVTAMVVAKLADAEEERLRASGDWAEFDEETLNDLTKTAYFPSGTREWLEQRQGGIGGSDVGPIMRIPGSYSTREDVMLSKLEPITDEQVAEQESGHSEFSGAAGRGNAWEKRIFIQVKKNNPDKNITFCKSSWKHNVNEFQFANFDGVMTDENGHPDGIVEIKTASVVGKWGKPEDGLDGVPATYRTQVLWYAQAAGFKRGMVAVVIDDREYREYHFTMTPELEEEANRNLEAVKVFQKELAARKAGTWQKKAAVRGFSNEAVNSGLDNKSKKEIFAEVATMRGVDPKVVQKEFMSGFDDKNRKDRTFVAQKLRSLYVETAKMPELPDYVGVDLETAGSQPSSGRILEFGGTLRTNYAGELGGTRACEKEKLGKLYGLSRKTLAARGTGNSDVHGISESQIAKKRQFNNPEEGVRVLSLLKRAKFMMAHNLSFENRWMRTHVPGYADAVRRGEIGLVDTMKLNRRLFSDSTPNDKMESFTARFDVPYIDSHRAYSDSVMMSISYEKMLKELREEPAFTG
jgi:DNA polymerase III epsilon subunit-like protein/predicted phage-related endonuclease